MNAFEYLQSLPRESIDRLYKDPWACQAVFQSLPLLSKHLVLRLLSITSPVAQDILQDMVVDTDTLSSAMSVLIQANILIATIDSDSKSYVHMNTQFQSNLQWSLSCPDGRSPWEHGRRDLKPEKAVILPQDLEHYARSRWNAVLHFMVGSTAVAEPPASVVDILLRTKLMQPSNNQSQKTTSASAALHITNAGYEFMLKGIHEQMWVFMLEYIKTLDLAHQLGAEDSLTFLFQLSYCEPNTYYAISDLSKAQQLLLNDFLDFGLLYRRKPSSKRFYTTSLAVHLIFGGAAQSSLAMSAPVPAMPRNDISTDFTSDREVGSELVLVVETNFKIYAYTTSSLHIAMLSVFVDIVTRLPNLAVGFITRESVRSALMNSISAQQIYDFMSTHAHPFMKRNTPAIPENIADQMFLWERERNRIEFMSAMLLDGFNTKDDFDKVHRYAEDLDALLWADAKQLRLAVAEHAEGTIRTYIRNSMSR